jgi:hypothetical protein
MSRGTAHAGGRGQVSEPELVIRQDPCNGCEPFFAKMRKRCAPPTGS